MPLRIDLHTHSTASDGTDAPAALVAAAALPAGISLVRGAEFSCVVGDIPVHLLGYLFDPAHPAIVAEQARLRAARHDRLLAMTGKIADACYPVDVDTV